MDPVRELAQLVDGDLQLVGAPSSSGPPRVDAPRPTPLRAPELERERDQPLLRAVVQVALDPTPLLVGRGDDPRARLLHLLELRAHLRVEPRVLEGETGSGARPRPASAPPAGSDRGRARRAARRRARSASPRARPFVRDLERRPPRRRTRRARAARTRPRASGRPRAFAQLVAYLGAGVRSSSTTSSPTCARARRARRSPARSASGSAVSATICHQKRRRGPRRPVDEREHAVEDRSQGGDRGRKQERREDRRARGVA